LIILFKIHVITAIDIYINNYTDPKSPPLPINLGIGMQLRNIQIVNSILYFLGHLIMILTAELMLHQMKAVGSQSHVFYFQRPTAYPGNHI
jgi:hypothetical protein